MTEHYTHFDPKDFGEVPEIQAMLLKPKTEMALPEKPALKLLRINNDEMTEKRRKVS